MADEERCGGGHGGTGSEPEAFPTSEKIIVSSRANSLRKMVQHILYSLHLCSSWME